MAAPTLFIGVVSHSRTRFTANQGEEGLAAALVNQLNEFDTSAVYSVNILNEFESAGVPANRSVFRAGIAEEVRLEREWKKFLGVRLGLRDWIGHVARWLRVQSFIFRKPDTQEIKRLINIEVSHTKLMREGLDSGAQWVLILEDDAAAVELKDLVQGLVGIISHDSHIAFVNLSRSFDLTDLGIDHLLHSDSDIKWAGPAGRQMLFSDRPATNTVCAILYHRAFLVHLINEFELIPSEPVVPIDWRLNQGLMNLWNKGVIGSGDCWFVEPAPIDQLSMRST